MIVASMYYILCLGADKDSMDKFDFWDIIYFMQ